MTVWDAVVGQTVVVDLQAAAVDAADVRAGKPGSGSVMTHAWLFTGPPGSGRSVLARAFAAGLQCDAGGCGVCDDCVMVLGNRHPDVLAVATEGLSLKIADVRGSLIPTAARRPQRGHWQVVLVEDADRLTDDAADALLLAVEEPPARTVWLLCAPTAEDIVPTIRSRCRSVQLRTPPVDAVAAHLVGEGVDPTMAQFAAQASMGHIGRARALAVDEGTRLRRAEVLRLPLTLGGIGSCIEAAASLVDAAQREADARCDALDGREVAQLKKALGVGPGLRKDRDADARLKELEKEQKARRTRVQRDSLDRALVDVLALYRDVLMAQLGAGVRSVNEDVGAEVRRLAVADSAESTLRRIDAVVAAREAMGLNAAPALTLEALAVRLREG